MDVFDEYFKATSVCPILLENDIDEILSSAAINLESEFRSKLKFEINDVFNQYFTKSIEINVLRSATASDTAKELNTVKKACDRLILVFNNADTDFPKNSSILCMQMQAQLYAEKNGAFKGIDPMEEDEIVFRNTGEVIKSKVKYFGEEFIDNTITNVKILSEIIGMAYENERTKVQKGKSDKGFVYSPFTDLLIRLGEIWKKYTGNEAVPGGAVETSVNGEGAPYLRFIFGIFQANLRHLLDVSPEHVHSILEELDITKEAIRHRIRGIQNKANSSSK